MFLISIPSIYAENITDDINIDSTDNINLETTDKIIFSDNHHYSATLSYKNQTPCSNQSLIFSVNNVNYTRITNDKGVADININLPVGVYPIYTIFNNTNNQTLMNNNTIHVSDISGTIISDNMTNDEIQSIFDLATANETIIFTGDKYENIALNISKNPLNILAIMKTVLIGNNINPIFTVESTDTKISNFIMTKGNGAVFIKNSHNISIENNIMLDNVYGISIEKSNNVNIFRNNISNSLENAIILKKALNTNISSNFIMNNYDGIYFDDGVEYTNIENNNITESKHYGVNLDKSGDTSNIKYNIISNNENGINIDCVGDVNLIIEFNTISSNFNNGINIDSNYRKSNEKSALAISNNSIIYNSNFNILGRYSIYDYIQMGDNWIASTDPSQNRVCEKIKFNKMVMNVEQIDSNTLSLNVDGIITPFKLLVSYNGGKNWQGVTFVNGHATIHMSNADGNIVMQYYNDKSPYQYQLDDYVPYVDSATQNSSSQSDPQDSSSQNNPSDLSPVDNIPNDSSSQTNGTNYNNNFDNSYTSNPGSSSNDLLISNCGETLSGSVSSYETSENIRDVDSNSHSSRSQSVAKSINFENDNIVRISGISVLLFIIILIIGLYYMDDIKFMLNRKNGQ